MYHTDDTIVAIASAPGGAARGIVRLSGPQVASILEQCLQTTSPSAVAIHYAGRGAAGDDGHCRTAIVQAAGRGLLLARPAKLHPAASG